MTGKYGKIILGAATAFCLSSAAMAAEEKAQTLGDLIPGTFSGSLTLTSDYAFRGVSQTRADMALQGGLTWKHDSGFYVGTWGSTINFSSADDSFLEQDFFTGYTGTVDAFTYDFSATFLFYPKESDYNYWEFAAKGAYDFGPVVAKAGLVYGPDYFGVLDNGVYVSTGLAVPIPVQFVKLTADANVGYTKTDKNIFSNSDYVDWNVGLNVALNDHLSVDLRYVDTNETSLGSIADARFVGGATFAF